VNSEGQVVIPEEIRIRLGMTPGTVLVVRVEGGRIVLQSAEGLLAELRGMFAGGPSLEDELYKDRRAEKW
jgi:AbrB family looped-hinge helix DNA binding protein